MSDSNNRLEYLDIAELASYIKRSKGAIRNLVLRRAIPYRKPAGRLIFLKEEIDQWVRKAPGKKLEEIENDQWHKEKLKPAIKRNSQRNIKLIYLSAREKRVFPLRQR